MNWDVAKLNSRSFGCLERLEHAKIRGFNPKAVFDVGAYVGKWAKQVHELYPEAKILLVEPNQNLKGSIEDNVSAFKNLAILAQVAAGSREGKLNLNIWKNPKHKDEVVALAASSLLSHVQGPATELLEVRVATLDSIAKEHSMSPDLLKLDLQGYELEALKGASKCIASSEMCIIEFGCLDAYQERTTPNDVIGLMYGHGFVLYDIVDLIYRPYDGGLVGGDFFFVRKDSKLKAHKDYF